MHGGVTNAVNQSANRIKVAKPVVIACLCKLGQHLLQLICESTYVLSGNMVDVRMEVVGSVLVLAYPGLMRSAGLSCIEQAGKE